MAIDYNGCEEEWLTGKLANLSAVEVEQAVDDNYKERPAVSTHDRASEDGDSAQDSYKAFKSFEGSPNPQKVAQELRSAVQAFKKNMPIIQGLCQPAIKTSHLLQLFEDAVRDVTNETGRQYDDMDVDIDMEDGLTLTMCLEAGMLDHVEKVEAISTSAQKQHGLKVGLGDGRGRSQRAMAIGDNPFGTLPYKNTGTFLLKGADDVQALLDDHIIKTQAVRGSPFVKPIEKEVKDWEAKLIYIQDLLEQWLMVQRTWLYLEPIFSSEDIVRQMPDEAKKFQAVDKQRPQDAPGMSSDCRAHEVIQVLDVSEIENLLLHFSDANKKLDQIQKCLNDYLETKRLAFPRFFFLSNDELLMILSQTKDPTAVQPHMGKCFEGINKVRFDQNDEIIEAMLSVEGEVVELVHQVNVNEGDKKGNVERWLLEVQDSMIKTLTKIMGDSVRAYAETSRGQWVLEWPGQVVIAAGASVNAERKAGMILRPSGLQMLEEWVDNIYWTQEVAEAIEKGKLEDYYQVCASQLHDLVELVRGELSKLARRTLTAMVTIDVHNRDVVGSLRDAKISSAKDSMATLLYGFEYLGNSDRLVVTPLTDRCYRTLMGAFHLFYGGAPEGPAGTGKTESTKDLAKAMSVQCVVFNCSDGLDYLAMGKFFKGLASSGAWCCFDEFNRIDLEVLSVIAQQVACIQEAIRMKKRRFIFEETELELIPTCAVNITMNPGYAGRSELPDNLKALFRPCAMMVPDYALIGEIVLYSVGFGNAKPLAAKAVASLRLGSEQLSSQVRDPQHAQSDDVGLRGFGSSRAEDILMLSALNDVNLPKFTSNDIPLFLGITGDLFPGTKLPPSDYGKLINELEGAARARHLQPKASFIHKCTQLWETIMVRHGLMVVGMNVSGKTEVENVLSAALAAVADGDLYLPCQIHKINPKSIKQGQLYGDFDENTHEWTDGILALTVRYTANADPSHRQWIMLDGPVDAVWIENMNTVLDDNKKLCLNSGEIIKLSPVTTMMFEVEDLTFASPATVSRCGMVFMEQVWTTRERVFAFRDFVVKTWDLHDAHWTGRTVLDVAGGKGDLSWLLANADALDSVVVDPRCTDHTKITRTAKWHFEPLGVRISMDFRLRGRQEEDRGPQGPLRHLALQPPWRPPRHLRVYMDPTLDQELLEHRRKPFVEWKFFWEEASKRAEQTERCGHHQSLELENSQGAGAPRAVRIEEAAEAIHSCSLILGFHPDQATEACIDLALELQRPFAVCPCCVFPKDFPERKLYGRTVKTYPDFIEYLRQKHPSMRFKDLCFEEGGYSRSIVLYMLQEDFDGEEVKKMRRDTTGGACDTHVIRGGWFEAVLRHMVPKLTETYEGITVEKAEEYQQLETAPERLQDDKTSDCGEQLKTLFETNVDQCWEMCQRKAGTLKTFNAGCRAGNYIPKT
ncbi:Dynein axonemal heavy chain 1 (Axonemal beta dynein heavy chain 1) (Ciliary dynein heavy chain 1) (mDHC7) [Durusdinium trenchii]|uniref:Dynein axonemal heavy chain 1 (Axonemal beta dynein heavy chain 1) (Ciliary dynein heavy chain 1) (MDHC7) n=1 Tax=Durusdinium trenchii TaxID=1381693 RepID=A0ABP0HW74_9DINO